MSKRLVAFALALFTLPLFGASIVFNAEVPVAPAEYGATPGWDAQVATSGEIYAATWTDSRVANLTAYVARFRADGSVLDGSGIPIPHSRLAGTILWTGRAFLIAYIDDNRTAMARTLTVDGVLSDPVELFGIFYLGPTQLRMATNGETVLIVSSQATAALLDLDGRKLHQFPMPWDTAFSLDVEAAGSTYLVAGSTNQPSVVTQIVKANGELGSSRSFPGTGVAVASDGDRFLLVSGRDTLNAQLVSREGEFIGAQRALAPGMSYPVTAVWRDGEYLVGYSTYPQSFALRVSADGAPVGNVVTIDLGSLIRNGLFETHLMDIAAADGEGVVVGATSSEGLVAAFFDAQSITAPKPLQTPTRINNAARPQSHVRLARNGNGIVAGWLEQRSAIRISAGGSSEPVLVANGALAMIDVVVESGVVWVVWNATDGLYVRRYTTSLQPLDAAPRMLRDRTTYMWGDVAVAGGGGAVAVAVTIAPGAWDAETFVEAHILRSTPVSLEVTDTVVSHDQGLDHDVAVAYDGNAFVLAWANATAFYSHRPRYDLPDDILMRRMTTAGTPLGTTTLVAGGEAVANLFAARGTRGVAAAWQTIERRTYAAYVDEKVVHDLGGEGLLLGSLDAHENGFLLARGSVTSLQTRVAELEVIALDSSLALTSSAKLGPFEVDPFWSHYQLMDPFDADVLGGPSPLVAYARVSHEAGGVSRLFTRGLREAVRRRAVR